MRNENKGAIVENVDFVGDWHLKVFPNNGFPMEALPLKLRIFIERVAFAFRISVDIVAMTVLTIISAVIGNAIRISPKKSWREPLFLWFILVAKTGVGKSPYINYLISPLFERQKVSKINFDTQRKKFEQEKSNYDRCLRKGTEYAPGKPILPRYEHYIADEMTLEALSVMMESSPRGLLLYKDELSGLILGFDQYKNKGGNDRQKMLSIWSGNPLKIDRVSQENSRLILKPGLAILGAIQPSLLKSIFGDESLNDGFLPRFILGYMEDSEFEFTDDSVEEQDNQYWNDLVNSFYKEEVKEDPLIIRFDSEAKEFFKSYCKDLHKKFLFLPSKYEVFVPKLRSYLVRLGGLVAIINKKNVVDRVSLVFASRMVDCIGFNLVQILRISKVQDLDRIQKLIVEALVGLAPQGKHGKLELNLIREQVNSHLDSSMHLSAKDIGGRVRKFGFETKEMAGYYHVILNKELLDGLIALGTTKSTKSTKPNIPEKMSRYETQQEI